MSRTMLFSRTNDSKVFRTEGFTLVELLTVLVILVAMVTITIPYATRSNDGLKLDQESRNVAEAMRYATHLAIKASRPVRFTLDLENNCYFLEMVTATGQDYAPVEDPCGAMRPLDRRVQIADVTGFSLVGKNRYCLSFDPERPWPEASLCLALGKLVKRVRMVGRLVEVEDVTA